MSVRVSTPSGEIIGLQKEGYEEFRGIPYAEQPIGVARFKAPEPLIPFDEPYVAETFKDSAPQEEIPLFGITDTSEDCLYLNIWTPASDNKKRPVMVWIHGGAFITGAGSQQIYKGKSLAVKGDVVVVTLNYRLGALGYLYLNDLLPEASGVSANNGLLDQIEALRWVQKHIESFGGDPNDITLFGESAGAMSVATLMACPSAKGLFHKVILQSGAADQALTRDEATEIAQGFLKAVDVSPSNPEKLWQLTPAQIVKAQRISLQMSYNRGVFSQPVIQTGMTLLPVIDGTILPQSPLSSLKQGESKHIPMMLGCTREEWNFFMKLPGAEGMLPANAPKEMSKHDLIKVCEATVPGMGERVANHYEKVIREANPSASYNDIYSAIESDRIFRIPTLRQAEAQSQHNEAVYLFHFDWDKGMFGACHASDIPFVFGNPQEGAGQFLTGGSEKAQKLSSIVQSCWLAFTRSSDPSTDLVGKWPRFSKENRQAISFNDTTEVVDNPFATTQGIWEGVL